MTMTDSQQPLHPVLLDQLVTVLRLWENDAPDPRRRAAIAAVGAVLDGDETMLLDSACGSGKTSFLAAPYEYLGFLAHLEASSLGSRGDAKSDERPPLTQSTKSLIVLMH
jgi:hypothetical protein